MSVIARTTFEYYYDLHPTEEDLMGYGELQGILAHYLLLVLKWLFRSEGWFIPPEMNIYVTRNPKEVPTVPDVAVFKVALPEERDDYLNSYYVEPPDWPPPAIVFEIASKKTWKKDLDQKPAAYAAMGVHEYVYYDPRLRRPKRSPRMRVWRYADGVPVELPADERGWVWSEELESWLAPEGRILRLYDRYGNRRLTGEEAERAARDAERAENERLRAKLRELGIDPDAV